MGHWWGEGKKHTKSDNQIGDSSCETSSGARVQNLTTTPTEKEARREVILQHSFLSNKEHVRLQATSAWKRQWGLMSWMVQHTGRTALQRKWKIPGLLLNSTTSM
jgi:hypothetical protein